MEKVSLTKKRRKRSMECSEMFVAKHRTSNAPSPTTRIMEYRSGHRYRVWSDGSFRQYVGIIAHGRA